MNKSRSKTEAENYKANWKDWKKLILTKKEAKGLLDMQKILREVRGR
jgi:hypothetical protein